MNRFVRKVNFLPELLMSMVESSSAKFSNSQLEKWSTKVATQAKHIEDLQNDVQNHLYARRTQATLIKSQKTKIELLEREVQIKAKQLQDQVLELENIKILWQQESKKLQAQNLILKEKFQVIQEQSCKIDALSSENQGMLSFVKARSKTIQSLSTQVANQIAGIKQLRQDSKNTLMGMQAKFLTEIGILGSRQATESATYLSKIKRLKLEIENKGNQLRSQAEDINDFRNAFMERSEKLSSLMRLITHLKKKNKQLTDKGHKKVKAQATLNQTLVSKIENLWKDVNRKDKELASKNKEIENLKSTISDITKKQRAQLAEMSCIVNNFQKYKQEYGNGMCNMDDVQIKQLQDQTNLDQSHEDRPFVSNPKDTIVSKYGSAIPGAGVYEKENASPRPITKTVTSGQSESRRGLKRATSESLGMITSERGLKFPKVSLQ